MSGHCELAHCPACGRCGATHEPLPWEQLSPSIDLRFCSAGGCQTRTKGRFVQGWPCDQYRTYRAFCEPHGEALLLASPPPLGQQPLRSEP